MNVATLVVVVAIALAVLFVITKLIRDKRNGRTLSCGGDCSHCAAGCDSKKVQTIKYVFIDLDDTIFDFSNDERNALSKTLRHLGVEPNDEILSRYSEINLSRWKLMELGKITRDEVKVSRYRILFDEFSIDASPQEATAFYEAQLAQEYSFVDGALQLLDTLYGKYSLNIVSNGATEVQDNRIDSAGIRKYFDNIFISQAVGADKPSSEFFDYCFSSIDNINKKNCVIVGDSISSDIRGGINAGIKTIWFNRRGEVSDVKPDYTIESLSQLPQLLERI